MSPSRSVVLIGGLAVASAVVGVSVMTVGGPAPAPPADRPDPVAADADPAPPPGTRLVGLGPAVVAVPERWGTNAARCGVPQEDTVVVDVAWVDLCAIARPPGVDSVELTHGEAPVDFRPDRTLSLDGGVALRQDTTCAPDLHGTRVCEGIVRLPASRVSFRAVSSTSAAEVDRVLARVTIAPDRRGVPGYEQIFNNRQARSGQRYADVLREAGFTPRLLTRTASDLPSGFVTDVFPPPGTVLDPGALVVVGVSG